jgi:hypothetical protein
MRKVPVPVTGASYRLILSFVLSTCFSFLGIWGFLFSDSFFNYLSQESSNVVTGCWRVVDGTRSFLVRGE